MDLPAVEGVVGGAETLLERAFGVVVRAHVGIHVVIAEDVEERHAAFGQRIAHRPEERRAARDVADDVAAGHAEGLHPVRCRAADVRRGAAHAVELLFEIDLRIGHEDEAVARHVASGSPQREVVPPLLPGDAPVKCGRAASAGISYPSGRVR